METEQVELRFKGVESIYGLDGFNKIQNAKILLIGIGGVGSWCAESLIRSGVINLTMVDLDDICVSNTNRQIHAHEGNYGKFKVDALEERMKSINPKVQIKKHYCFFNEKNLAKIMEDNFDIIIDAMDSVNDKCFLFDYCFKNNIQLISSGAAGGKKDIRQLEIAELEKTKNDMLFKSVRKKLRRDYHYPVGRGKAKVQCVYSKELGQAFEVCEIENKTQKLDCEGSLGSLVHITSTMGMMLTNLALEKITN